MDSKTATQIWIWSVMLLLLKMFAVSFYTAIKRRGSHTPANPEDKPLMPKDEPTSDPHDVERGLGLHRNDMENIYVFIFISLIYPVAVSLTAVTQNPTYLNDAWAGLNLTFLIARYAYSACYIWGWQPFRTIFFAIGQLICAVYVVWSMVVCLL